MYDHIINELNSLKKPIDIIVVGLGFMGFGFLSNLQKIPGMRVPLVISRDPNRAKKQLIESGFKACVENNKSRIENNADNNIISVSDNLNLIAEYDNKVVFEVTGTVAYATQVSLIALKAKKHLVTMNPELQATVGGELKKIADKNGVVITDVIGDQPGSLANLIAHSKLMGFKVLLAGNMKRFMNRHATQAEMKPWAQDKGLATRQTVSFTDGTKQSIEMTLVANYFDMDILQFGMKGPQVESIQQVLEVFDWESLPSAGIVDYAIGKSLFPGVFIVVEHTDPNQQKYLRYLGLGEGPRYVLFEPYHLCHLEVPYTIAKVALHATETINNGTAPKTQTIAVAKFALKPGDNLDGIGGDMVYGNIDKKDATIEYLPMGLTEGAVVKNHIHQDQPMKLSDVILPKNAATVLAGIFDRKKKVKTIKSVYEPQSQTFISRFSNFFTGHLFNAIVK